MGPRKIQHTHRSASRRDAALRNLPHVARAAPRVPLLPRAGQLQAGELRRREEIQRTAARNGAGEFAGDESEVLDRRKSGQGGAHGRGHCERRGGRSRHRWRCIAQEFWPEEVRTALWFRQGQHAEARCKGRIYDHCICTGVTGVVILFPAGILLHNGDTTPTTTDITLVSRHQGVQKVYT